MKPAGRPSLFHQICIRLVGVACALLLLVFSGGSGWVWAGTETGAGVASKELGDHEQARQAVAGGRILPLHDILSGIEHGYQGQVLSVALEHEHEQGSTPAAIGATEGHDTAGKAAMRFVYKIRLLQAEGRIVKLKVDAANGRVLSIKRREP